MLSCHLIQIEHQINHLYRKQKHHQKKFKNYIQDSILQLILSLSVKHQLSSLSIQHNFLIIGLISKKNGITGRSQTQTVIEQEISNKNTSDFQTIYQRILKANYILKITHINTQKPQKIKCVSCPITSINYQFISQKENVQFTQEQCQPSQMKCLQLKSYLINIWPFIHLSIKTNILNLILSSIIYPKNKLASKYIVFDCIYGQTGSGKTHTMGLLEYSKDIIQLALSDLFQQIKKQNEDIINFKLEMSFIQIYIAYQIIMGNLVEKEIQRLNTLYTRGGLDFYCNQTDRIQLVSFGIKIEQWHRHLKSQMSILQDLTHFLSKNKFKIQLICSKIGFIDIVSSERNTKSLSKGLKLDEAPYINESLSALGNVIAALVQLNQQHVPQRESKLTRTLQGYILNFTYMHNYKIS